MCDDNLLSWTKDVLNYLVKRGPGFHTIYSLEFEFYKYTGNEIRFDDLGYGCLLTFLQSIPETLNVNLSTFEVQPTIEYVPARHISSLSYRNQNRVPLQCCHVMQPLPTVFYQPKILPWVSESREQTNKRQYRPIPIKKPYDIIDMPAPLPLGPRSFGDGKYSSSESIMHDTELHAESKYQTNNSNDQVNCSNLIPTNLKNRNISTIEIAIEKSFVQSELDKDEKLKEGILQDRNEASVLEKCFKSSAITENNSDVDIQIEECLVPQESDEDEKLKLEEENLQDLSEASSSLKKYLSSSAVSENNSEVDTQTEESLVQTELDQDEKLNFGEKNLQDPSAPEKYSRSEFKFDEKFTPVNAELELRFAESPPPPYLEKDDMFAAPVHSHPCTSFDYDRDYYLSSPEVEKVDVQSDDESAIPRTFSEDDEINLLDSDFLNKNYGCKYTTTPIDSVMSVGGYYELYVSEVHNPYKFWFQLDAENSSSVDDLQENLNKSYDISNYESNPKVIKKEHMRIGYACAAMYQNIWHRGEIQGTPKDEKVKIYFVDYGTIDEIPIVDVRYLLYSFCRTPKLCHRGTLDFVKPIRYSWSNEATFFFINLVRNKKLIGGVSEIDDKTNSVRLYLIDREADTKINYCIVREGYGVPDDPRDRYQRHIADAVPSFDSLEKGGYPTLDEEIILREENYAYEQLMQGTVIDELDSYIPSHFTDEQISQRVEEFRKKKEDAIKEAKQRDATTFLQFFGDILSNPFLNGTMAEEIAVKTTNPFLD